MIPKDEPETRIENHLKNFRPRAASPLALPQKRRLGLTVALASAAVIVLAFVVLMNVRRPQSPSARTDARTMAETSSGVTVMQLNVALRSDESLDLLLDEAARRSLPRTTTPHTALNALSKD